MRTTFMKAFVGLAIVAGVASVLTGAPDVPEAHAVGGNCIKVPVRYSQFDAEATTDTVTLYTTRASEVIDLVVMQRDTDFAGIVDAGPSITAYTVSVGKSGAVAKYQSATDVFTGVSNGYTNAIVSSGTGAEAAGVAIIATATSTSANLNIATAGQLTFWICTTTLAVR
jgi:hypothetical protein